MQPVSTEIVRLEITVSTITRLLAEGHLSASELRCLDSQSMHCLRRSCLRSCVWRSSGLCREQCPHRDGGKNGCGQS